MVAVPHAFPPLAGHPHAGPPRGLRVLLLAHVLRPGGADPLWCVRADPGQPAGLPCAPSGVPGRRDGLGGGRRGTAVGPVILEACTSACRGG